MIKCDTLCTCPSAKPLKMQAWWPCWDLSEVRLLLGSCTVAAPSSQSPCRFLWPHCHPCVPFSLPSLHMSLCCSVNTQGCSCLGTGTGGSFYSDCVSTPQLSARLTPHFLLLLSQTDLPWEDPPSCPCTISTHPSPQPALPSPILLHPA